LIRRTFARRRGSNLLRPGRRIGEWTIGALLGRGATSEVYEAVREGTVCALKLILPEPLRTGAARQRLLREISLSKRIVTPRVAHLVEVVEEDDVFAIVMERVPGESLAGILASPAAARMPVARAHRIVVGIAAALADLHHEGILHRDLKPANVMLTGEDDVRLVDLGLSRATDAATIVTTRGQVRATLLYASPEILLRRDIGPQSDLYMLGLVTSEILTGQPTFSATDPTALVMAHLSGVPVLPGTRRKDLSPWWDRLVARLLEKEPRDRYPSASAVLDDLETLKLELTGS
jgi:serine/threonine protein kinase